MSSFFSYSLPAVQNAGALPKEKLVTLAEPVTLAKKHRVRTEIPISHWMSMWPIWLRYTVQLRFGAIRYH